MSDIETGFVVNKKIFIIRETNGEQYGVNQIILPSSITSKNQVKFFEGTPDSSPTVVSFMIFVNGQDTSYKVNFDVPSKTFSITPYTIPPSNTELLSQNVITYEYNASSPLFYYNTLIPNKVKNLSSTMSYTDGVDYSVNIGDGYNNARPVLQLGITPQIVNAGMNIDTVNGYVGINKSPAYALDIDGTIRGNSIQPTVDNSYSLGTSTYKWTVVYAYTGTINTSDVRQKTDISNTQLGLMFINDLRPIDYRWIEGQKKEIRDSSQNLIGYESQPGVRIHHGFISQEVKQVLDKYGVDSGIWILSDISDSNSSQGLRYSELIAPMARAIQELSVEKDSQAAKIATLEAQNATLQAQIDAIKAHIGMT
jgi:hypothetical protein